MLIFGGSWKLFFLTLWHIELVTEKWCFLMLGSWVVRNLFSLFSNSLLYIQMFEETSKIVHVVE